MAVQKPSVPNIRCPPFFPLILSWQSTDQRSPSRGEEHESMATIALNIGKSMANDVSFVRHSRTKAPLLYVPISILKTAQRERVVLKFHRCKCV